MQRLVRALVAAGGLGVLLSGCVVAPANPYYGYGYSPAPVVVQPSVGIGYSRGYYGGRGYGYGRGPYGGWWR